MAVEHMSSLDMSLNFQNEHNLNVAARKKERLKYQVFSGTLGLLVALAPPFDENASLPSDTGNYKPGDKMTPHWGYLDNTGNKGTEKAKSSPPGGQRKPQPTSYSKILENYRRDYPLAFLPGGDYVDSSQI